MAWAGNKGIFHTIGHHGQDRNWGELAPGTITATGWAGHQPEGEVKLYRAYLFLSNFISLSSFLLVLHGT